MISKHKKNWCKTTLKSNDFCLIRNKTQDLSSIFLFFFFELGVSKTFNNIRNQINPKQKKQFRYREYRKTQIPDYHLSSSQLQRTHDLYTKKQKQWNTNLGWTILFDTIFIYVVDTYHYRHCMYIKNKKKQKINLNWWNNRKCLERWFDRFIVHDFCCYSNCIIQRV